MFWYACITNTECQRIIPLVFSQQDAALDAK